MEFKYNGRLVTARNKAEACRKIAASRRCSMKYRKKPVEVEAFQFSYERDLPQVDWFEAAKKDGTVFLDGETRKWCIKTLEGDHTISEGDFVIQGVKGELYPCKPDIFEKTYEAVVDN